MRFDVMVIGLLIILGRKGREEGEAGDVSFNAASLVPMERGKGAMTAW